MTAFATGIITLPTACHFCFLNAIVCLVSHTEDCYQEEAAITEYCTKSFKVNGSLFWKILQTPLHWGIPGQITLWILLAMFWVPSPNFPYLPCVLPSQKWGQISVFILPRTVHSFPLHTLVCLASSFCVSPSIPRNSNRHLSKHDYSLQNKDL